MEIKDLKEIQYLQYQHSVVDDSQLYEIYYIIVKGLQSAIMIEAIFSSGSCIKPVKLYILGPAKNAH